MVAAGAERLEVAAHLAPHPGYERCRRGARLTPEPCDGSGPGLSMSAAVSTKVAGAAPRASSLAVTAIRRGSRIAGSAADVRASAASRRGSGEPVGERAQHVLELWRGGGRRQARHDAGPDGGSERGS